MRVLVKNGDFYVSKDGILGQQNEAVDFLHGREALQYVRIKGLTEAAVVYDFSDEFGADMNFTVPIDPRN